MKPVTKSKFVTAALLAALVGATSFAQDKPSPKKDAKPGGQPSEAEMMATMMELGKPSEHHRILQGGLGTWTYTLKAWMDPSAPPTESSGTMTAKSVYGGRYFTSEHDGRFPMPGPDGKIQNMEFKGTATEGYDNAKKKYFSTWIDNMSTGIMVMEGTYDPTTTTITYTGEYEPMPGMKTKARQTVKIVDHLHRTVEMFETRGDKEVKVMEIQYTRHI